MKNSELIEIKNTNEKFLNEVLQEQSNLENNPEVQKYLNRLKIIKAETNLKNYLNTLVIGDDNTVFSSLDISKDKCFRKNHIGLSILLLNAFYLLEQELDDTTYTKISFKQLIEYRNNAENLLKNMCFFEGDRLVPNQFNLEIYENPNSYSIVELDSILPMTNEQLKSGYQVKGISIQNDYFIKTGRIDFIGDRYYNLTPREKEAFYGIEAKKILGIVPKKVKVKAK